MGRMDAGIHRIPAAALSDVHDGAETTVVVVLSPFAPQRAGGPAFWTPLVVSRR